MHAKSKFRNAGGTLTEPSTLKLNIPRGGPVLAVFFGGFEGASSKAVIQEGIQEGIQKMSVIRLQFFS